MTLTTHVAPNTLAPVGLDVPAGVTEAYFRRVIAAAFTGYHASRGTLPDVRTICKYMGGKVSTAKVAKVIGTDEFKKVMKARGIVWSGKTLGVTPEQSYAIQILTDPTSRKSFEARLKAAGISHSKWNSWCKQPLFAAALKGITESALDDNIPLVHTALTNKALAGDMRAVEFYYKISGRFDPEREQQTNMNAVLLSIIEVLTRRITDTTLLAQIGEDLENIMASSTGTKALSQSPIGDILDAEEVVGEVITPTEVKPVTFELPTQSVFKNL